MLGSNEVWTKVQIKQFSIVTAEGTKTYSYEDGMTWYQWIESQYNTDGWDYSRLVSFIENWNFNSVGSKISAGMNVFKYAEDQDNLIQERTYYYRMISWLYLDPIISDMVSTLAP